MRVHILQIILIVGAYVAKIIIKVCNCFAVWYHILPYQHVYVWHLLKTCKFSAMYAYTFSADIAHLKLNLIQPILT